MNDLIDFADVGPIPEPTIWTKPPLDLAALEAKIIGLTPQWPLPGPAEKAMRELIAEVRELRKDGSALAANQCIHTDGTGLVGDEGGNAVCLRAAPPTGPTGGAAWIPWFGGKCPIPDAKTMVFEVRFRAGEVAKLAVGEAKEVIWENLEAWPELDIIAYRVLSLADERGL